METPTNGNADEHTSIDITRDDTASERTSTACSRISLPQSPSSSPASFEYRLVPYTIRNPGPGFGIRWILIELAVIATQFVSVIAILCMLHGKNPGPPLIAWVAGYVVGCIAALPRLYWRYLQEHDSVQESSNQASEHRSSMLPIFEKYIVVASPSILIVEAFFLMWFVVGDSWLYARPLHHCDSILARVCMGYLAYSALLMLAFVTMRDKPNRDTRSAHKLKMKIRGRDSSEDNLSNEKKDGTISTDDANERVISAEDAVCCICLSEYVDNDELLELPCNHIFHRECIDVWLHKNPVCPICKKTTLAGKQ